MVDGYNKADYFAVLMKHWHGPSNIDRRIVIGDVIVVMWHMEIPMAEAKQYLNNLETKLRKG